MKAGSAVVAQSKPSFLSAAAGSPTVQRRTERKEPELLQSQTAS